MDCRNCSTNSSNTSTKGAKLMWGATKDCCSRSVRDVDDVAVGFPPSPRRFSRPPVNRKFVAPDSPLDRPPACRDGGQLTAAGRSTTGRVESWFWIEGDSGSQVQNLSRHAGLELERFIKCCGPQAASWLEALDRESQIQHGVAGFRGYPGIKGLLRWLFVGSCWIMVAHARNQGWGLGGDQE